MIQFFIGVVFGGLAIFVAMSLAFFAMIDSGRIIYR